MQPWLVRLGETVYALEASVTWPMWLDSTVTVDVLGKPIQFLPGAVKLTQARDSQVPTELGAFLILQLVN